MFYVRDEIWFAQAKKCWCILELYGIIRDYRGVAQLVARSVWDAEVACSSQVAPTRASLNVILANSTPVKWANFLLKP